MSLSEKAEIAQQMGAAEDFPTAWSDQHWLGKVATEMEMYTYQLGNLWQYDSMPTLSQKEPKELPSLTQGQLKTSWT